jgi:hypothetical protein
VITTSLDSPQILNYSKDSVKLDLTQLWSLKLFATAIETPPELNIGPGVFYSDLQTLRYHLEDIHTLYLTNEEDIEFSKVLSAKQCLEKAWKLNL